MNILKYNPECFRCKNEGWVINTLGVYISCPICHNSRLVRILKENIFNFTLKLFKLFSDYLKSINWASDTTLSFARLYNVETAGKIEYRQDMPFENYQEVFKNGNFALRNKIAYKLLSDYAVGYTVAPELVRLCITELVNLKAVEDMVVLAQSTHGAALLGKDKSEEFYRAINANLKG